MKNASGWSRRDFIRSVALAGSGSVLMSAPLVSWALDSIDPQVIKIVADTLGIDTHNHIDVPMVKEELPGPDVRLSEAMIKAGLSAICMTFAVDYRKLDVPGMAYERFLNGLSSMDQQLKNSGMKRSFNVEDLFTAHKAKLPTVIQAVEGAHFLEGHIERLQVAYDKGLRLMTLLHDSDASVPLGDVFTNPVRHNGLTPFGAEVIRECERLGIAVDLSHADVATVTAALKVAQKPVFISHTGLDTQLGSNPFMAKMMSPRLISKEHAKFVAGTGGVIGIWTHLTNSALEYAQNIRAMVDVVGIDHVCIGTDTKLTPAYNSSDDRNHHADFGPKPGETMRDGSVAKNNPANKPAGSQDKQPKGAISDGPKQSFRGSGSNQNWPEQKSGFYYAVVEAMLKTGFNATEIGKIGGGNFLRVFGAATGGK